MGVDRKKYIDSTIRLACHLVALCIYRLIKTNKFHRSQIKIGSVYLPQFENRSIIAYLSPIPACLVITTFLKLFLALFSINARYETRNYQRVSNSVESGIKMPSKIKSLISQVSFKSNSHYLFILLFINLRTFDINYMSNIMQ